jgi:hypothetical protein
MADRYWVPGGTLLWSSTLTANWSASSGGAGGASVPTESDNVFFDANSNVGTGAFTVTMLDSPRVCNNLNISGLDGAMTLAGAGIGLTISGSLLFPATNLTITYSGTTTFNATTSGKTITANGKNFNSTVTFNGIGGEWVFGSAFSCSSFVIHTNGTIDTSSVGNYAFTWGQLSSASSSPRMLNLNASTCNTGSYTPGIQCNPTNWAFNAGTSTINFNGNNATGIDAAGGGLTFYNVAWPFANSSAPIAGANTFNNFTVASKTSLTSVSTFTFASDQIINGTLTVTASTGAPYRTNFASLTLGTARTLTCASIAAMSDVDFRDITIAGAHGTLSGTRLGNCTGNTNITFPAAKTVYYRQTGSADWGAVGSGSWSATSGGALDATQFPLAQDTAVFPAATYPASGSTTTINAGYNIGTIDMSLRTSNTMTLTTGFTNQIIYGDWIGGTGITNSSQVGYGVVFSGRTTQAITSAGRIFTRYLTINSPSGSVTLQDALTAGTSATTTLTAGTLNLQSYTLSSNLFNSSNFNTRTIAFGTGNITCTGTGTVWTTTSYAGLTTTGTQVVNVTSTGSTSISVNTGVLSEANSISYNFTGGTYTLTFLTSINYTARSVNFTGFAGTLLGNSTVTIYGNLTLSAVMSQLSFSTNTMTFGATSGTQLITSNTKQFNFPVTFLGIGGTRQLQDDMSLNSSRTFTLISGTLDLSNFTLSTGLFDSNISSTRTIAFGTGNITCTGTGNVWNTYTTTNLTTTGTQVVNVTSVGSTAISVIPYTLSEANSISFNFTGGTYALTIGNGTSTYKNLNFTGFAGSIVAPTSQITVYGNLTFSSGMTLWAQFFGNIVTFAATSGTQQITTNAKTLDFSLAFNGVSGTVQLQDALTMGSSRTATLTNGTLDLFGKTLTVGTTFTNGTGTKNLTFNGGTLVCPTASTTSFNNAAPTNFTTTAGTGTGTISMTAATAKTFVGAGSTFNCTLNQGGAGALTITGSNTFSNITNTVQPASVLFTAATTSTFSNFSLSGTAGNLITIGSVTAASHTLSKASGAVSVSYCSISRSSATGGATWEALTDNGNVNGGNNSGWFFGVVPSTGNFLMFF